MSARSYLYVPADRPEMLAKAADRGADALIVDLEDAVAPSRKVEARRTLSDFLPGPTETWVRVNNHADLLADDVAACAGAAGIVLAKAEPETLSQVVSITSLPLTPLIETAAGLLAAKEMASVTSVERLAIGEADLSAELGVTPGDDGVELLYARSKLVVASAAAGIDAPTGPVYHRLPGRGRAEALDRGPGPARLRKPAGHPSGAGPGHQRGLHSHPGATGRRPRADRGFRAGARSRRRRGGLRRRDVRRGGGTPGPTRPGPSPTSAMTGIDTSPGPKQAAPGRACGG